MSKKRFCWLSTIGVFLSLLAAPGISLAGERRVVGSHVDCEISVGDRDEATGTDLVIATCIWEAPAEKIREAISSAERHDDWLRSVASSHRLPDGRILQVHQNAGVADRQVALDFTSTELPNGGLDVSWTRADSQEPLGDGRVEALVNDGSWILEPSADGRHQVTYKLRYDPAGRVPMWIVRSFQKDGTSNICADMLAAIRSL